MDATDSACHRSLTKGVELGLVHELPVVQNLRLTFGDSVRVDSLRQLASRRCSFANKVEKVSVRHPLNTLEYDFPTPEVYSGYVLAQLNE